MANINNLTARGRHLLQSHMASLSAALTSSEGKETIITKILGFQFSPAETLQTGTSPQPTRRLDAQFELINEAGASVCHEQDLQVGSRITTEQNQVNTPAGYVQHKISFWSRIPRLDAPATSIAWIDNQKDLDDAAQQAQSAKIDQLETDNKAKDTELTQTKEEITNVRARVAELEQQLRLADQARAPAPGNHPIGLGLATGGVDDEDAGSQGQDSPVPSPVAPDPANFHLNPFLLPQAPGPVHQTPPLNPLAHIPAPPTPHGPPPPPPPALVLHPQFPPPPPPIPMLNPLAPIPAPLTAPQTPGPSDQAPPPAPLTHTPPPPAPQVPAFDPQAPGPSHPAPPIPGPDRVVGFRALKNIFEGSAVETKPAGTGDGGKPDKPKPLFVKQRFFWEFGTDTDVTGTGKADEPTAPKAPLTHPPAPRQPIGATEQTPAPMPEAEKQDLGRKLTLLKALASSQPKPVDDPQEAAAAPVPTPLPTPEVAIANIPDILGCQPADQDRLLVQHTNWLISQLTVLSSEVQTLAERQEKPTWPETKELRGRITLALSASNQLVNVVDRTVHSGPLGRVLTVLITQLSNLNSEAGRLGLTRTSTLVTSTGIGHSTVLSREELHVMRPLDDVQREIERSINAVRQQLDENS